MANGGRSINLTTCVGFALAGVGLMGSLLVGGVLDLWNGYQESRPISDESVTIITDRPKPDPVDEVSDDPAADDGELHDARTSQEGYGFKEGSWSKSGVEHLDAYDADVDCSFFVRYPQLTGDLEHRDEINELLERTAMQTVRTYYEDPSSDTVAFVHTVVDAGQEGTPEDVELVLSSVVDYAVTYNSEKLLSVCFSDQYYVGSNLFGLIQLRTVNVNLETGEIYELDDVLTVSRSMATSFVDNLVRTTGEDKNGDGVLTDDECFTVELVGRESLERALRGKGELAKKRVTTCFFVDGNGKVNLGATYWLSNDVGLVRGWWDVTLTGAQVRKGRKASSFWGLLP